MGPVGDFLEICTLTKGVFDNLTIFETESNTNVLDAVRTNVSCDFSGQKDPGW